MPCCITSTVSHLVYHLAAVPWLLEQGAGSHKWIRLTGATTCGVKSCPKRNTDKLLRPWHKMGVPAQLIENDLQESMLGLGARIWRSLPGRAWTRHEQVHSTLWRYGIMGPRISMVKAPNSAFPYAQPHQGRAMLTQVNSTWSRWPSHLSWKLLLCENWLQHFCFSMQYRYRPLKQSCELWNQNKEENEESNPIIAAFLT